MRLRRTTGMPLLTSSLARRLGMWPARDQLRCPHPAHRERAIHGDERNRGYLRQCLDCGLYR